MKETSLLQQLKYCHCGHQSPLSSSPFRFTWDEPHQYYFWCKEFPKVEKVNLNSSFSKEKFDFINATCKSPDLCSSEFPQWSCCNDMMTSWLLNSLTKNIGDSVIYSKTAKELWDSLERRFEKSNQLKLSKPFSQKEFDCPQLSKVTPPLDPTIKLQENDEMPMSDPIVSRHLIGKINYLYSYTSRFEFFNFEVEPVYAKSLFLALICCSESFNISSFGSSSRYPFIFFSYFSLITFCNVDWASCSDSWRFVRHFYITMGGSPISWK